MTAKGKIQRIKAAEINIIGRNTQGVRIMNVDEGDSLIAIVRVPPEEAAEEPAIEANIASSVDSALETAPESFNDADGLVDSDDQIEAGDQSEE